MFKFKQFMKKLKKNFFIYIVVWLIIAILLIVPLAYTITQNKLEGISLIEGLTYNLIDNFFKFPIGQVMKEPYISDFVTCIQIYSVIYIFIVYLSISKTLPKNEYDKIEHGSSAWCEDGEQYKILSKKSGIILAKDHYLPTDKEGNINVLIVGRFWFW